NPDVVKEKPDFVKENPASVKEKPAVVKEALRYSRKVDKERVVGLLDLNSDWTETEVKEAECFIGSVENFEKEDMFKRAEEKLASICSERVHGDDGDDDGDGNGNRDDDGTRDDDARGDSDMNRDDDNADSRNDDDVGGDGNGNEDENGNGDDEDGGCKSIEKQVDATTKEVDAMTKENVVEESDEITFDEYLYGDALDVVAEDMRRNNEGTVTPERLVTRHSKASPSPNKRMVKPSSYLLSPYMNKKIKVLPKINRSEFMIGTSLFAMQRDKIETVFETTSGEEKVFGIRLNMETLSPGLCIDANVVDCWAEILNYEDRFRKDGSLSRHFFPMGCIKKSMFDGTLPTYEENGKVLQQKFQL
ncbi:hypothetical protein Tco_1472474, partial [Tanacetum coccineum]